MSKANKPNPNDLQRLAELADSASQRKRPPIQEVRPIEPEPPARQQPKPRRKTGKPPEAGQKSTYRQLNSRVERELAEDFELEVVKEKHRRAGGFSQRQALEEALQLWIKQQQKANK